MKRSIISLLAFAIIIATVFTVPGALRYYNQAPPPGYTIKVNATDQYRWETKTYVARTPFKSRYAAINRAWVDYRYLQDKAGQSVFYSKTKEK